MTRWISFIESKLLFNFIVFYKYWELKTVSAYSEEKLALWQRKKIKKLVKAAVKHKLYRDKFEAAGIDPSKITTPEDFERIPCLTKDEYRNMVNDALDHDTKGIYKYWHKDHTSGSTGMPLHTCLSPVEYATVVAQLLFILQKNGYRLFLDSSLDMTSPVHKGTRQAKSFLQKFGMLRKTYVSAMDAPEDVIAVINREKPTEIVAGKSNLNTVLRYADEHQLSLYPAKYIVNTAEAMDEASYAFIEKFFGKEALIDSYASIEAGILAYTMRQDRHKFHLLPAHYLYRILDENGVDGDNGMLYVTRLYQRAFPMINYRQGDAVESFVDNEDGRRYLSVIRGRADDYIFTRDGKRFSFHHLFAFLPKSREVDQYRVIQEDYETLRLVLVQNTHSNRSMQELEQEFSQELNRYLTGAHMDYIFEWVDQIPMDPNGKIRAIISKVKE